MRKPYRCLPTIGLCSNPCAAPPLRRGRRLRTRIVSSRKETAAAAPPLRDGLLASCSVCRVRRQAIVVWWHSACLWCDKTTPFADNLSQEREVWGAFLKRSSEEGVPGVNPMAVNIIKIQMPESRPIKAESPRYPLDRDAGRRRVVIAGVAPEIDGGDSPESSFTTWIAGRRRKDDGYLQIPGDQPTNYAIKLARAMSDLTHRPIVAATRSEKCRMS